MRIDQIVNFYCLFPPEIEKIKKEFIGCKIQRSPYGTRYLLQPKDANFPSSIYSANVIKLKNISANDCIAISDQNDIIIRKSDTDNKIYWQLVDNYEERIIKIPVEKYMNQAKFTFDGNIITWGKLLNNKSTLVVYNRSGDKVFEKVFDEIDINIEWVVPCQGSKLAVFTSDLEIEQDLDIDLCSYIFTQINCIIIDYHRKTAFRKGVIGIKKAVTIGVTASKNTTFIAGLIDSSKLFILNTTSGKLIFPQIHKASDEKSNNNILQMEVFDEGTLCVLRSSGEDNNFMTYEKYDETGNLIQTQLLEDISHNE